MSAPRRTADWIRRNRAFPLDRPRPRNCRSAVPPSSPEHAPPSPPMRRRSPESYGAGLPPDCPPRPRSKSAARGRIGRRQLPSREGLAETRPAHLLRSSTRTLRRGPVRRAYIADAVSISTQQTCQRSSHQNETLSGPAPPFNDWCDRESPVHGPHWPEPEAGQQPPRADSRNR